MTKYAIRTTMSYDHAPPSLTAKSQVNGPKSSCGTVQALDCDSDILLVRPATQPDDVEKPAYKQKHRR
ncbi:hypothetical protein [Pseudofrankia sp. DC12]|uniref:hypothetical protein n=1 Tax=Pseudofrankia sp. DC12 TaxID=683315 RepID=UPI0018DB9100|nr:hypothetical protein [Pseudofrankia sp. DC12]